MILVPILGAVHKLRHLVLDHSRPLPSPLSSCVIFWHTPTYPPTRWRNLWMGNDISMIDYFVRRTITIHGYFSSWSNCWCFWGERVDFHCYISMVRVSYSVVIVFSFFHLSSFVRPPPSPLSSFVIFWPPPWVDDVIYEQPHIPWKTENHLPDLLCQVAYETVWYYSSTELTSNPFTVLAILQLILKYFIMNFSILQTWWNTSSNKLDLEQGSSLSKLSENSRHNILLFHIQEREGRNLSPNRYERERGLLRWYSGY